MKIGKPFHSLTVAALNNISKSEYDSHVAQSEVSPELASVLDTIPYLETVFECFPVITEIKINSLYAEVTIPRSAVVSVTDEA